VQIAWSASGSKSADTSGALQTLADQPFGKILLWLVAVGLVALALWQASEALWGYRNREGFKRVRKQVTSGAMAAIYAALGVSAASVALGSGSSSSQSQEQATSGVLAWPGSSGELLSASVSCGTSRAAIAYGVQDLHLLVSSLVVTMDGSRVAARLVCWRSGAIRMTSQARWQRSRAVMSHAPGSSCQRLSP
jgi:hypothetical protein